jgi:hypothetical protein
MQRFPQSIFLRTFPRPSWIVWVQWLLCDASEGRSATCGPKTPSSRLLSQLLSLLQMTFPLLSRLSPRLPLQSHCRSVSQVQMTTCHQLLPSSFFSSSRSRNAGREEKETNRKGCDRRCRRKLWVKKDPESSSALNPWEVPKQVVKRMKKRKECVKSECHPRGEMIKNFLMILSERWKPEENGDSPGKGNRYFLLRTHSSSKGSGVNVISNTIVFFGNTTS